MTDADILKWIKEQKYGRGTSVQGAIKTLRAIHDCFPIGTGRAGPAARLAGGAWNK